MTAGTWRVAVAVSLTALSGTGSQTPPSLAAKPALELVQTEGFTFLFDGLGAGSFVAYGTSTAAVHQPVRVVDVQPYEQSGSAEFVRGDLAFYACQPQCRARPGYWGTTILMGGMCAAVPPSSRALYPAKGMALEPGDAPMFIVVARLADATPADVRGVRITYEAGGLRYEVASPVNRVSVSYDKPHDPLTCGDPAKDPWLGGARMRTMTTRL